jgi:hypothetical protein
MSEGKKTSRGSLGRQRIRVDRDGHLSGYESREVEEVFLHSTQGEIPFQDFLDAMVNLTGTMMMAHERGEAPEAVAEVIHYDYTHGREYVLTWRPLKQQG